MDINNPYTRRQPDTELTDEPAVPVRNLFHYTAGMGILVLNKMRHHLRGYQSTRGFPVHQIERAVYYDLGVVKRWEDYLEAYRPGAFSLQGRKVLELGPGADLGVGLITLARGAAAYHAMDIYDLATAAPLVLYERLFDAVEKLGWKDMDRPALQEQLSRCLAGDPDRLNYVCRADFDLSVFQGKEIDLVVSNSAFQQFDNPSHTIAQLGRIVRPGGLFIALVDLKTHTRWIRTQDPLNIYRYPDAFYRFFTFRGSPNRLRPHQYQAALEANGWTDVRIFPRHQLPDKYLEQVQSSLHRRFRDPVNQMNYLTVVICATKL